MFRLNLDKVPHQDFSLRPEENNLYEQYYELLQSWNSRINLVSRKSIESAAAYHYWDSIRTVDFAAPFIEDRAVYDVGSGAGFPGLVFAIRFPTQFITLYEKSLKKQSFLSAAVTHLALENVSIQGSFPEKKSSGFFFSRAVFPRADLFRIFQQRLAPGSRFVVNSGGSTELTNAPAVFKLIKESRYALPNNAGDRKIELFHVEQKTR